MSEHILYILMRKDLPSMNAGKAMAQASHATSAFSEDNCDSESFTQWSQSTSQHFGTALVLAADKQQIIDVVGKARQLGIPASVVDDPSYPYRADIELASLIPTSLDTIPRQVNGNQVTLWRNEMTCAYVFGTKEELAPILGHLPLHP